MNKYIKPHEWKIIEEGFNPDNQESSESIFSLGNGRMGQRANFEEFYSGQSLQGSYLAGIYYPDKTKVGWWKNGYPEYFAKVLNSTNWIGIDIEIEGIKLDLNKAKIENFLRTLDMQQGILSRSFTATLENGKTVEVDVTRFLSMDDLDCGVIRYQLRPLNFSGKISFIPYLDGDVKNRDANYDEKFWNILESDSIYGEAWLLTQTKKLDFRVGYVMRWSVDVPDFEVETSYNDVKSENRIEIDCTKGKLISFDKFVTVCSSLYYDKEILLEIAGTKTLMAKQNGFEKMLENHTKCWAEIWKQSDIKIKGDIVAQQSIRFNIFQLNQTYRGDDARLNIGPKGFTGEKYGGSTYWDTEAYCLPFFLSTAPLKVSRNLLIYRYNHLSKAIENAEKLGFSNGAALYPMVTMNGEECHNEWEITFEEIHRNGAIAFAIFNYIRHSNDIQYLEDYGIEVLIAIARFWAQRVSFSNEKNKYVILGVTGPNEYENNVNNNWYTNKIAKWCLEYTLEVLNKMKLNNPLKYKYIVEKTDFNYKEETSKWNEIIENIFLPYCEKNEIFLQQEGYLDKEQILVSDIPVGQRPINQHWSWDRILRSCFIKQADVLQGIYMFENEFDTETIRKHFDFYEPRTVHESSLSPCVHAIIAARINDKDKAYSMFCRTARLDLDDFNNEVSEGLHITSMAGTWMAIVEGFGGKRVIEGELHLNPIIPKQWKEYSFIILFRGNKLEINVSQQQIEIFSHSKEDISIFVYGKKHVIKGGGKMVTTIL